MKFYLFFLEITKKITNWGKKCIIIDFLLGPLQLSLFETVLVTANDELVKYYLDGIIDYNQIFPKLLKILNFKKFKYLKKKSPRNLRTIYELNKYVRLKTRQVCIR